MLFSQIINNIIAKMLLPRMVSSKFIMEATVIVTVPKLFMFQIENFVLFIDYGDVGQIL